MKLIPLNECKKGRLYKLRCRNLSYGVFDGETGFIGIRFKFTSRFLFTEIHWDACTSFGTVKAMEDTGIDLPEGIELKEGLGSVDQITGRPVAFDKPTDDGGRGWYFIDTDEASKEIRAMHKSNKALFEWLDEQGSELDDS